jgi:hypothetical protein
MPKQTATATMEGTRKRGRPCKRQRDDFEGDLNVMRIKNRQAIARGRREWTELYWKPRSAAGCSVEAEEANSVTYTNLHGVISRPLYWFFIQISMMISSFRFNL